MLNGVVFLVRFPCLININMTPKLAKTVATFLTILLTRLEITGIFSLTDIICVYYKIVHEMRKRNIAKKYNK